MKKIRFFFILLKEYLRRRYKLVLVGFLLGIIFFYLIPAVFLRFQLFQKPTKIGLIGKYTIDEIPKEIQLLISKGLTEAKKDGEIVPSLAESWQVEEDGKKYAFNLRKDIKWPDGKKFTANDVNYNFEDVEIQVINDYQVGFLLKDPFSPFPMAVSRPIFRKGLIGLGDYRVKRIDFNGEFVESIGLTPIKSKEKGEIIYKFYPTEESAKIALKLGEVTGLRDILDPHLLENFSNLQISSMVKDDRFVGLFFNTEKPFLEDRLFRQALAYAVKKDYPRRAYSPISPLSWAYFEDVKPYDYNLKRGQELLENSLGEIDPGEIELTIHTVPQLIPLAESIRKDWQELGIKVEIGPFMIGETDFQVLLAIQEIPADPDQYNLWHSTSQNNITHLRSPRIDKLLEDGRVSLEQSERKKIYFDFQRFLAEEVPVIFLYYPEVYNISRK